ARVLFEQALIPELIQRRVVSGLALRLAHTAQRAPVDTPAQAKPEKQGLLDSLTRIDRPAPFDRGLSGSQGVELPCHVGGVGIARRAGEGMAADSEAEDRFTQPVLQVVTGLEARTREVADLVLAVPVLTEHLQRVDVTLGDAVVVRKRRAARRRCMKERS